MPLIAEVRFVHPDGALTDTFQRLSGCRISVVREASTTPERSIYVFQFAGVDPETARDALETDHSVAAVEPMPGFGDEQLVGVEFTDDTRLLAPEVTGRDGFVVEARSSGDGETTRMWHERWLLPDGDALHEIWQYASEAGFTFDILNIRQRGPSEGEYDRPVSVSDEQREALVIAYGEGYFAEPREVSLEELATTLELSPTAVAGRLRRGMYALVAASIGAEDRR
ncbi:helix-turn-helix domain-containing protein [Halobaculum gomorrense]|uniref:GAF and HTH_10 associated domain-containing protein n=1 Tax=Halobaculum gomorrense TaxID=43928 RepID=A0A1M5PBX9_9EURY|nr:helix-turn-helix domain-containing protein [Halobaculum gomorrense]SHG99280.1 hypothetical protein SAMN05443636_1540 [Halobaculum gomorrense]